MLKQSSVFQSAKSVIGIAWCLDRLSGLLSAEAVIHIAEHRPPLLLQFTGVGPPSGLQNTETVIGIAEC